MKNNMIRFLSLLMALLMLSATALTAVSCDDTEEPDPTTDNGGEDTDDSDIELFEYESDKWLVQNGVCRYGIVYTDGTKTAAEEFRKFFSEATGCTLYIYEDGFDIPEGIKLISLGETSYAKAISLSSAALPAESFRVLTDNDNIYIVGESDDGVLWGVYKLLKKLVNYEFFKADCYSLDTGVKNLNMFKADWTEIPDIAYTPGFHGLANYNNGINAKRYRLYNMYSLFIGNFHNTTIVLDASVYNDPSKPETYHPGWYSTTNDQLCYTARGNKAEYEAMVETVADYFVERLLEDETKHYVCFNMMDNRSWCDCSACKEYETKYGAKSTGMLIMSKDLHTKIKEKLASQGDTRELYVIPMLYNAAENLPVVKDEETGEYKFTDPSLNFDGLIPLWAVMAAKVHSKSWADEANAAALEMLEKFDFAFNDGFWVWDYGVDFNNFLIPYNIFDNMEQDFKLLKKYNIKLYLYQLDHTQVNSTTAFGALKAYLLSQLMWDADQDVEELTDKFFENVYGPGADAMREIYEDCLNLWERNSIQQGDVPAWDSGIYSQTMMSSEYYPRGTVREWLDKLDEANEALLSIKLTNPGDYSKYEYNIMMEGIFVRYIYASLYLTANSEENTEFKLALYNDFAANFSNISEGGGTWELAKALGIDSLLS